MAYPINNFSEPSAKRDRSKLDQKGNIIYRATIIVTARSNLKSVLCRMKTKAC